MQLYAVIRRNGWRTADDLREAAARSHAEGDQMSGDVSWIRSYVLSEPDGSLGTVCIYQATSPEASASTRSVRSCPWTRSSRSGRP